MKQTLFALIYHRDDVRMDDQEILAAIGHMVLSASVLEWEVAVLVAVSEGRGSDRAREIAGEAGEAVRQLHALTESDRGLRSLLHDVQTVLEDRDVLVHALAFVVTRQGSEDFYCLPRGLVGLGPDDQDELLFIWSPRDGSEQPVTIQQLRLHDQGLSSTVDRVRKAAADRTAGHGPVSVSLARSVAEES